MVRRLFIYFTVIVITLNVFLSMIYPPVLFSLIFFGPIIAIGIVDMLQKYQAVRKNFPVIGNLRYLFEKIRPANRSRFVKIFNRLSLRGCQEDETTRVVLRRPAVNRDRSVPSASDVSNLMIGLRLCPFSRDDSFRQQG